MRTRVAFGLYVALGITMIGSSSIQAQQIVLSGSGSGAFEAPAVSGPVNPDGPESPDQAVGAVPAADDAEPVAPELVPPEPELVWATARDVVPSKRAPIAPIVFNFVIAYSRIRYTLRMRVSQPTWDGAAFFRWAAGAHNFATAMRGA